MSTCRVLELEQMKENVNLKAKDSPNEPPKPDTRDINNESSDSDTTEDEDGIRDIDEYMDWRSKKAYK